MASVEYYINKFGKKEGRKRYNQYHRNYRTLRPQKRRDYNNGYMNKYRRARRIALLTKYANNPLHVACACCGLDDTRFLSLDHIIPRSKTREHRQHDSSATYSQIAARKDKNANIQVLCYNCNLGKGNRALCPHKEK